MALSFSIVSNHVSVLAPAAPGTGSSTRQLASIDHAALMRPSSYGSQDCFLFQSRNGARARSSKKASTSSSFHLSEPWTVQSESYSVGSQVQSRRAAVLRSARASSSAEVSTSGSTESEGPQSLQEQKAAILRAVANTNRGKNTTPRQRKQILDLIETVEPQNPTPDPIESPLISGTWSLLYTASTKEEFTFAGTEEGPFLARVKPAAFGQVRSKGSTQIIDSETGHVDNIAEFSVLGKPGSLTITGSFAPAAPLPDRGAVRIDVRFESFTLKLGWLNLRVPLGLVNPTGWIDTTYLDTELRIGRGDKGSVFVTARRK